MIRFLAISLFIVLVTAGCSLKTTEGLREVTVAQPTISNPYFSNAEVDYVYKAKIALYDKNFGGILIIKKTGSDSHRVVFTTEFGSKLFDFYFEGENFQKNFIIPEMDKKLVVKTLEQDFRLLISEKIQVLEEFDSEAQNIYKTDIGKNFGFYFFEKDSRRLRKIVKASKRKEKVTIDFKIVEENIAQSITLQHENFKLRIELEKFKKE
ncbi:hypothetical protein [Aequorivita echinoideorum]|uniref:Lipoprotein n=1 Tax=Aequorivita echinoideorum TaxID=1549647 RepID=A0ABS5S3F9_9FLAO|nr:hypothetical protein [Aequorivita echinoideorum]MBT0607742.1 hypothetical protein [Aequorivita echinoideorum]